MNFLQRTPFLRLLLALITGIIVSDYLQLPLILAGLLTIISILLLWFLYVMIRGKTVYSSRWLFGFFAMFALFWIGFFLHTDVRNRMVVTQITSQIPLKVRVTNTPELKEKSVSCQVQIQQVPDSLISLLKNKAIALSIHKDSASANLKPGDVLIVFVRPDIPAAAMNPQGFDYRKFLQRKAIHYTAYAGKGHWKLLENKPLKSIRITGEYYRDKLLNIFSKEISQGDEYAVLSALILGYQEDISKEMRENFSYSGTLHILAVSGLHVAIIYMLLQSVLDFVLRNRKWKLLKCLIVLAFLWFYALITGLSPSVVRSAVMFSFIAFGNLLERKSLIYNTIAASAFFILIYNTNYIYDLGFQLSYGAVLSIIYFQPLIRDWFTPRNKAVKWLWDLTSVSLAAQMGTLPLILYYFNQFPNYFLLGNLVAVPLSTFIIYISVAWLLLSFIQPVAFVLAWVNELLLKILNESVQIIHDLPVAVTNFHINFFQFCLMLMIVILSVLWIENRKYLSLLLIFILIFVFVVVDLNADYQSFHQKEMIVYADRKQSHVEFISGKNHQLFTTDKESAKFSGDNYRKKIRLKNMAVVEDTISRFLVFEGQKILLLKDDLLKKRKSDNPFQVDVLILDRKVKYHPRKLFSCVQPRLCIVGQSVSAWYSNQTVAWCIKNKIKFHVVAEKGAYRHRF